MTVKKVLIWPDPELSKVSKPIVKVDETVRQLVKDLIETMEHEGSAAGLSAPQIGVLKRVFVVNIPPEDNEGNGTNGHEAFINPEIFFKEGVLRWEEGCLSVPGERGWVTRASHIKMRFTNLEGEEVEREAFDYLGGCFQHELDHLDGKLWVDYQSFLKRKIVKKKMLKLKKYE